jgi:RNA polymerase sigma-70 factor (ECF subfamily)
VAATRAKSELHLLGHTGFDAENGVVELKDPAAGSLLRQIWDVAYPIFEAAAPLAQATALAPGVLAGVRARDPEALGSFFDAYFPRVYALAARLLGDRTRAEDATSDVFLRVHRAADRLDPARDPWPWLVTVTTNVCRDLWRSGHERMQRHAAAPDEPGMEAALGTSRDDPAKALGAREREQAVHVALAALPEDLRLSVVLYDYVGRSHEEIAELLGISHDAARKRHSRALKAMGRTLSERLGERWGA